MACKCLIRIPTLQIMNFPTLISRWYSFDVKRQSRIMKKLMTGSRKNWYKNTEKIVAVRPGSLSSLTPPKQNNTRRMNVLNAVLIRAITEVMATGEVGAELLENNVEITRVKVAQDFNTVNVYWFSASNDNLSAIEQLLTENAWKLRSEMCSLRVLGNVPHLTFVKDKDHIKGTEILNLLNNLSFDTNFDTGEQPDVSKSTVQNLNAKVEEIIQVRDQSSDDDEPLCAIAPLLTATEFPPDMKLDIYGLDYKTMMKSLSDRINQAKAIHRKEESMCDEALVSIAPPKVVTQPDATHFKEFLRERKKARNKEKKQVQNWIYAAEKFDGEKAEGDYQLEELVLDEDVMTDDDVTKD